MEILFIEPSEFSPEIELNHKDNKFHLKGNSRPEDVRELYYPVVKWINDYKLFLKTVPGHFSREMPFTFIFDLSYFNSSTAKFLYDIVMEVKEIGESGVPVKIDWFWEEEDVDMFEAGEDLALLAEMEFNYITKLQE